MAYPSDIPSFTPIAGTTLVATDGHANRHNTEGSAITALANVLGTTNGTSIAKNFAAGDFSVRMNSGSVLQQGLQGTFTASQFTGTVTGQNVNSGTIGGGVIGTALHQGGTVANAAIGTPTIIGGTVAVNGTVTPLSIGAALAPTVVTLTDSAGGTITPNSQAGQVFHLICGTTAGNRTIGTPANAATDGQSLLLRVKQNAAATGTILWASIFRFSDAGTPSLGTAGTYNYYSWRYNSIDTKWDFSGQSRNVI